ncbi:MAG: response regulator transcription factor [Chloroflexota bacterium]
MDNAVRVAILDDHQSILDGFQYRLMQTKEIKVVASASYGEDLIPMLQKNQVDVLLLDLSVPTSVENGNQFPMIFALKTLQNEFPSVKVIIISNFKEKALVKSAIDRGVRGYIYKDDHASIQQLSRIVLIVSAGGNYFSAGVYSEMAQESSKINLTPRQKEVLEVASAFPDDSTDELAGRMNISGSTLRNILSTSYARLGVHNRNSAIDKIRQMGIVPMIKQPPSVE